MSVEQRLKQTQYHWILGLRQFTTPCEPNVWTKIQSLTPDNVARLQQQTIKIQKKIWPLRFIYWLFNLANYAENMHLLTAYNQWKPVLPKEADMQHINNPLSYYHRLKRWATRHSFSYTILLTTAESESIETSATTDLEAPQETAASTVPAQNPSLVKSNTGRASPTDENTMPTIAEPAPPQLTGVNYNYPSTTTIFTHCRIA